MRNRRGQALFLTLMLSIFFFMVAFVFIAPLSQVIEETRNTSELDCSNSSITDGKKATCLLVDIYLPYFIGVVLAIAIGLITARFIGGAA